MSAVSGLLAQAPLLQDGATALRQARLDWTLGQTPLGPSSLPSFEAGLGGSHADGAHAPLTGGEGLGSVTGGWGLGLQGRFAQGGWSVSATWLALRDRNHTSGLLQRAALTFNAETGWRAALEQGPMAWGSGLNGGELLGDAARPFPRVSLAAPAVSLPFGTWRLEAFAGRLEAEPPIPEWVNNPEARRAAQAAGLGLRNPALWGGFLRTSFGTLVETSLGVISLEGGRDAQGHPAPATAVRKASLAELRVRIPTLAQLTSARGAAITLSRYGAPGQGALSLVPPRDLGGLQLVWEEWDLSLEYAGAARSLPPTFDQPAYLAGFSTHGEPLGAAFGPAAITRSVVLGLPLFLEGRGCLKALRATSALGDSSGLAAWFLQGDAQWRTPTGRIGASVAVRRNEEADSVVRWGWSLSLFQSFRVF